MSKAALPLALAVSIAAPGCAGPDPAASGNQDGGPETGSAGAHSLELIVRPERQWYHTEQPVLLVGFAEDQAGDPVADPRIEWTVDPAGAATAVGDRPDDPSAESFLVHREGRVTITGCAAATGEVPRAGACDAVTLLVDDGSPALELATPRPGAEVDDADGIPVRGSVADATAERVFVAGRAVEVDDLGQFETVVPARFGVNHLTAVASDGLTPESSLEMDVLWAPAYAPAVRDDGAHEVAIESGIALSMGQRLFDDGAPLGDGTTPITTEDLADLVELVVGHVALVEFIPDPVVDEPSFHLRIPDASIGGATASLEVTGDGLELFLRLPDLTLTTEGSLQLDDTPLDLAGTVTASVAGVARIAIQQPADGGPTQVELADLWLAVESAEGAFDSEETDAIFELAEGLLRTTIEDELVATLGQVVEDSLPALLEQVLTGLESGLADRDIVLENDLFPEPIALHIGGDLDAVIPTPGRDLAATLDTRIGTDGELAFPDTRGVALSEPAAAEPTFYRDGELQVGVSLALLNGALHALWSAGALEIDLDALLPDDVGDFVTGGYVSGKMPPVLRPARAGEAGLLVLTIGQVEIAVDLGDGVQARLGLTLEASLDLAVRDGAVTVAAPGEPKVRVWVIEASEGTDFLEDLIRSVVVDQWPAVRDALVGLLAFELPVPSLSGLADLAPALADMTLSVELARPPEVRGGHVLLHGALRGRLEAPSGYRLTAF